MEGVQSRARDQSGLILDPDVLNGLETIGKDDSLFYALVSKDPVITTGQVLTLFPRRVWKTGPYCFAHFLATNAWWLPNCNRLPKMGTPGISGKFFILGVSV